MQVDVLFALCDWRVHDCPVVKDVIKRTVSRWCRTCLSMVSDVISNAADTSQLQVELAESSVDALRQEPIGEDNKGNLYYYFSFNNEDCRLYRQEPPLKKSAKRRRSSTDDAQWETICTTVEEMADFVESLNASRYADELWQAYNHTGAGTQLLYTTANPVMMHPCNLHALRHTQCLAQQTVQQLFSLLPNAHCKPSNMQIACRSGKDKALHDLIASDILPQLIESAAARRRAEEKQAAIEAMPKKRSSRLQVCCVAYVHQAKSDLAIMTVPLTGLHTNLCISCSW